MEPLIRSKATADQMEGRLIALLSAAAPTALPESQKRRSLEAILAPKPTHLSPRFRLARPAVVFGIFFLVAGVSAAATVGASWIKRRSAVVHEPIPSLARPSLSAYIHSASVPDPRKEAAVVEDPVVELPRLTAVPRSHSRAARGEDASALMQAVKALRQEHDPARASRLLHEYLRVYPRGSLSEEARALAVEAARAQHSTNTIALADEYLRLYPHGRFRRAAEQASGRTDP